jgi:hypothetical protein
MDTFLIFELARSRPCMRREFLCGTSLYQRISTGSLSSDEEAYTIGGTAARMLLRKFWLLERCWQR